MDTEQIAQACESFADDFYHKVKGLPPKSMAYQAHMEYVERMNKAAEIVRAFGVLEDLMEGDGIGVILSKSGSVFINIEKDMLHEEMLIGDDLLTAIQSAKGEDK